MRWNRATSPLRSRSLATHVRHRRPGGTHRGDAGPSGWLSGLAPGANRQRSVSTARKENRMNRLQGKVAVVTGASKGIGASIAEHMAAGALGDLSARRAQTPGRESSLMLEVSLCLPAIRFLSRAPVTSWRGTPSPSHRNHSANSDLAGAAHHGEPQSGRREGGPLPRRTVMSEFTRILSIIE